MGACPARRAGRSSSTTVTSCRQNRDFFEPPMCGEAAAAPLRGQESLEAYAAEAYAHQGAETEADRATSSDSGRIIDS